MKRAVLWVLLGLGPSCNCGPPSATDAGTPDASVEDAGFEPPDAGFDAGLADAGLDAGQPDAGDVDAGEPDAGRRDAGLDAGAPDAGAPDSGTVDAGPDLCPLPSGVGPVFRLRAMAANLTSGNQQSYTPGEGMRIIQGADPDIVMLQEFNYGGNSSSELRTFVDLTFDAGFAYQRGAGSIPNGVISRWPILAAGEWTDALVANRTFTWAHVDLPGPNDVWVISVHLLTASATTRNNEAIALNAFIRANVPEYDFVLLGGDFNTDTRDTSVEPCLTTFSALFVTSGPYPADQFANENTSGNRNKPYDHVLASPCLARSQRPTVVGTSTFDAGLVIDTRGYSPISDLAPALTGDSAASNMQHMGVVKDFYLQP